MDRFVFVVIVSELFNKDINLLLRFWFTCRELNKR